MSEESPYYKLAIKAFFDFTVMIALPAIIAAISGKWLDARHQSHPRFLVLFLIVTFLATGIVVHKKAELYGKKYAQLIELEEKNKKILKKDPKDYDDSTSIS